MLKNIRENFKNGIAKATWFANVFAERLKIEISVIRLMHNSDEVMKKRGELMKTIGQRVYELRERQEKNVYKDKTISDALSAAEDMDKEMTDLQTRVSELTKVTE